MADKKNYAMETLLAGAGSHPGDTSRHRESAGLSRLDDPAWKLLKT